MLVLGIDPGTATTGYGLVNFPQKGRPKLVKFGWIKTEKNGVPGERLADIHKEVRTILRQHSPDVMAIERLFFYSNAKTAMRVGQAHGVLLLAAAQAKIPVHEYAPMQIKNVVTGNGRADKELVKKTIRKIFSVRAPNRKKTHFDDVADALAVALCHVKLTNGGGGEESG